MNSESTFFDESRYQDLIPLSHFEHHQFEVNGHTIHGEFFEDELHKLVVTKSDGNGQDVTIHEYDNVAGPIVNFDYHIMDDSGFDPFIVKNYEIKVPELMGQIVKITICEDKVLQIYLCWVGRDGAETVIGGKHSPHYNIKETVKN